MLKVCTDKVMDVGAGAASSMVFSLDEESLDHRVDIVGRVKMHKGDCQGEQISVYIQPLFATENSTYPIRQEELSNMYYVGTAFICEDNRMGFAFPKIYPIFSRFQLVIHNQSNVAMEYCNIYIQHEGE